MHQRRDERRPGSPEVRGAVDLQPVVPAGAGADGASATALRSAGGAFDQLRERHVPQLAAAFDERRPLSPLALCDVRHAALRLDEALGLLRAHGASLPSELLRKHEAIESGYGELRPRLADLLDAHQRLERETSREAGWAAETAQLAPGLGLAKVDVRSDETARAITEARGARGVALGRTVYLHPERIAPGTPTVAKSSHTSSCTSRSRD
jgi:hypothetical protein